MALLVGELRAALGLDDSGFDRGLAASETKFGRFGKKLEAEGGRAGKSVAGRFGIGLHGAIGGIVSHAGGIVAAGFAAWGSVRLLGGFIDDARESARIGRVTEQVIKSTGGAAKISAGQVGALATAISNQTGADDEAIQSGQNLLLTFTNIRNGVGKGNDIFNQASRAITDMTAALNNGEVTSEGMKASSIQLGKALNDPIKGVGALSRVGVSFTESQKKQIKTLVDSGKTMQAQKIILGELGKEFGGAAAAAGDPITKLKVIVGNASESIGGAFLPVVDKVATTLGVFIPAAVGKMLTGFSALGAAFKTGEEPGAGFVGVMQRIGITSRFVFEWFKASALPILKEFGGLITGTILPKLGEFAGFVKNQFVTNVIPAVKNLVTVFKPLVVEIGTALVGAYRKLAPPIISLGTAIASNVGPALKGFTGFLRENGTIVRAVAVGVGAIVGALLLYKAALGVVSIATKAYAAVQAALNVVMSLNPIGVVILALVGLSAGLVYAYKHSQKFREIVDGAFHAVAKVVTTVVGAVVGFFRDNWKRLPLLLLGPIGIVLFIFKGLPGKIVTALGNLGRLLLQAGKDLVTGLKNGITSIARTIGRWMYDHIISPAVAPFMKAGTWLHQAGKNVIAGFLNGLKEIWAKVTAWIGGIATWIRDHKGPVSLDGRLLVPAGKAIMSGFLKGLKSGAGPAWDFVSSVGGKTRKALEAVYAFTSGAVPAGRAGNVALGQRMAASLYGWTGAQWDTLYNLWLGESGWNNLADNPTSTAFGIPQFLAGTARQYGVYGVTDPAQQIAAGLRYIADRYGSPIQAFGAWMGRSPHWYAKGTPWVPDDQLAFVHRGEAIVPADVNRARRDVRAAPSGPVELGERSLQRLARLLAGIAITLDGKRLDAALSSRALQGGY